MAVTFDVVAATNAIAALERTVTTPLPGIITSFNYGAEPNDFTSEEVPAIVHLERGPDTTTIGRLGPGIFHATFGIESRVLLIKEVPGLRSLDPKTLLADLYLPLYTLFQTDAAKESLSIASGAFDYECIWESPSFTRGDWPIFSQDYKQYWIIRYTHTFTFQNENC